MRKRFTLFPRSVSPCLLHFFHRQHSLPSSPPPHFPVHRSHSQQRSGKQNTLASSTGLETTKPSTLHVRSNISEMLISCHAFREATLGCVFRQGRLHKKSPPTCTRKSSHLTQTYIQQGKVRRVPCRISTSVLQRVAAAEVSWHASRFSFIFTYNAAAVTFLLALSR